jgi:hypothetical protein
MHLFRILADAALVLSVLFLPWWATLVLVLVSFFLFESYGYELVAAGVAMDLLYGVPQVRFAGITLVATLSSLLLLALLVSMRRRMRV